MEVTWAPRDAAHATGQQAAHQGHACTVKWPQRLQRAAGAEDGSATSIVAHSQAVGSGGEGKAADGPSGAMGRPAPRRH